MSFLYFIHSRYFTKLIFITLILTSCYTNSIDPDGITIEVDLDKSTEIRKEEWLGARKIFLDNTKAEYKMDGIVKIMENNGDYIVVDLSKIGIFDLDGNFKRFISKQGSKKCEYRSLQYCWLERDTIKIFDDKSNKVLSFNTNGKYLKTVNRSPLDTNFESLVRFRKGYICKTSGLEAGYNCGVALIDRKYNLVKEIKEIKPVFGKLMGQYMSRYKQTVNYLNTDNYTVYSIDNSLNTKPKFHLDYGKYQVPKEVIDNDEIFYDYALENKCVLLHSSFLETTNNIVFIGLEDNNIFISRHNKVTHSTYTRSLDIDINDNGSKVFNLQIMSDREVAVMVKHLTENMSIHFVEI